jgi:hypothetical protein
MNGSCLWWVKPTNGGRTIRASWGTTSPKEAKDGHRDITSLLKYLICSGSRSVPLVSGYLDFLFKLRAVKGLIPSLEYLSGRPQLQNQLLSLEEGKILDDVVYTGHKGTHVKSFTDLSLLTLVVSPQEKDEEDEEGGEEGKGGGEGEGEGDEGEGENCVGIDCAIASPRKRRKGRR